MLSRMKPVKVYPFGNHNRPRHSLRASVKLASFIRDRGSAMGRTRTSGRVDGDIIR